MGRGRVELKLIENKINRQVTFAKRRNGLLKKAHELSVLCDAEVAVILFSSRGRLFDFCSSSSVMKIVQRYQKYSSYDGGKAVISSIEPQNAYQEYLKLKTRAEYLQSSQSNLLGEDLEPLNIKELTRLEDQIEMSLRHIRQTKNQGIVDQLTDLKRKEQMLFDSNKTLQKKLQELNEANMLQLEWQSGGSSSASKLQLENFSQPLGFPPLQPGISPPSRNPSSSEAMTKSTVAGFAAGWIWEAL